MPAPISHLAYAREVVLSRPKQEWPNFLRGCVFPDIRYLGVIGREQTHLQEVHVHSVLEEPDAWRAGFLYHSWTDLTWNKYREQLGYNLSNKEHREYLSALKMAEDRLWLRDDTLENLITNVLDDAIPSGSGATLGVAAEAVERWQALLKAMVKERASEASQQSLMIALSFEPATIQNISKLELKILEDKVTYEQIMQCHSWVEAQWQEALL